jgi:hypothetical protein
MQIVEQRKSSVFKVEVYLGSLVIRARLQDFVIEEMVVREVVKVVHRVLFMWLSSLVVYSVGG